MGHHACLREKEHLFRYRAYFEGNLLRFVRARAHVRVLIALISCAVGMRNAKLRNHLKVISWYCTILFPEATILLVSDGGRDLWPGPTPKVRDSRTSHHSAHSKPECRWAWPRVPIFPAHDKRDPWGRGWVLHCDFSVISART